MFVPLDHGQIRLLRIQPGTGQDIICDLQVVALTSCAQNYEALSYTWGSQILDFDIIIGEEPYSVTSNLYGALKQLRHADGSARIVWVDAICINQKDPKERTTQVNMMADIYLNAGLVIMWLGEEVIIDGISTEGAAFALLEQIQEVFKEHGFVDLDFQLAGPDGYPCPGYGLPYTQTVDWIRLSRVFSKPYFERIWIIQEVVKARKAVLACGSARVAWEIVKNFARNVRKGGCIGNLEYTWSAPGIVSINAMADLKEGKGIDLIQLLVKTSGYRATKEVDKVFALMNLASNSGDVGVRVDYSLENEPSKVWETLALHNLTVHQNLLCLSNAGTWSSSKKLQSWVADYHDFGGACLALHGQDHFKASGNTQALITASDDKRVLIVEGYIVDSVAKIAPEVPPAIPKAIRSQTGPLIWLTKEEDQERLAWQAAGLMNGLDVAKSAFKYREGVVRERELARTMCCDLLMTDERANIDRAHQVHQWWIKTVLTYMLKTIPEDPEEFRALQLELEMSKPVGVRMEEITNSSVSFGSGRCVCATVEGDLGQVPFGTRPGDLICIFKGGIVPFLLRKDGDYYQLVGECFVNGIMYGEALDRQDIVEQSFNIR
ncbi:heterokaryon incompatibility protein-domain-containing protein [Cadophora sp. MPI-SDFR-AT-0126]|nr:heterokaryon incompatibility protein-domain-containing protein [Leotiomycetes sp. MPI-SDFR-AT-0126]